MSANHLSPRGKSRETANKICDVLECVLVSSCLIALVLVPLLIATA